MPQTFAAGDDLVFQLESAFGILRVLAVDGQGTDTVWHLLVYEAFFPDVEAAERALAQPRSLPVRRDHLALSDRAFERTPAAKVGNRSVTNEELAAYRRWQESAEHRVSDRSVFLLLGMR